METLGWLVVVAVAAIGYWKYRQWSQARLAASVQRRLSELLPEQFIVFDLETTGLDPLKHEIIEIGAIRVNRDSHEHDTFRAFVKPKRKVPKKITEITGITQAMIEADGEPIEKVMGEFREFVGDRHMVAFNADFDMAFLKVASEATGVHFRNNVSCALKMARSAWPGRRSYRLKDLAGDGGLNTGDSHRALGDCQRTLLVYTGAVTLLGRMR